MSPSPTAALDAGRPRARWARSSSCSPRSAPRSARWSTSGPGRSTSPTASPASRSRSCATRGRIADVGAGAGFPGLRARRRPARRPGRPDRVGRPQVRLHARARSTPPGSPTPRVLNTRSEDSAAARGPRGLRRRHRPRRRPPLDPRRARIPTPEAKWRPRRLEGQTRRGRGGAARREPPSPWPCAPSRSSTSATDAGSQHRHLHVIRKSARPPPTSPATPASPRSAPRARLAAARLRPSAPRTGVLVGPDGDSPSLPSC